MAPAASIATLYEQPLLEQVPQVRVDQICLPSPIHANASDTAFIGHSQPLE
jgi:hypothetical protein